MPSAAPPPKHLIRGACIAPHSFVQYQTIPQVLPLNQFQCSSTNLRIQRFARSPSILRRVVYVHVRTTHLRIRPPYQAVSAHTRPRWPYLPSHPPQPWTPPTTTSKKNPTRKTLPRSKQAALTSRRPPTSTARSKMHTKPYPAALGPRVWAASSAL